MAFESAECALPHLLNYCEGVETWGKVTEDVRDSLDHRFQKRVRLALQLHRCLTHEVGRKSFELGRCRRRPAIRLAAPETLLRLLSGKKVAVVEQEFGEEKFRFCL